jgi:hypothetical protein
MFDLDLCNDCHQNVGIPRILVYLLNVNEVGCLVGKPFIPLSSLSEKLCWSVLWRILYSFLMLQDLQDQF